LLEEAAGIAVALLSDRGTMIGLEGEGPIQACRPRAANPKET